MSNLTIKNNSRFVLFPIQHQDLWEAYKEAQALNWTAEEIDLVQDLSDWEKLNDNERHFIKHVLGFFASSDGIVGENLAKRFYDDVGIPEARSFYAFQLMIETVHSEVYSLLIDTYLKKNAEERNKLFNALDNLPIIAKKAKWALKWIENNTSPFEERLIAFAAVEGIFFSSSFCSIYWLKKRGLMPGLDFSNQLISRDEGMHSNFACLLHSKSDQKTSKERIKQIICEAVEIEEEFCSSALPVELIGMNSKLMIEYVRFVADRLLQQFEVDKVYNTVNPFDFMENISLQNKTNFFEKRVGEYQKSGVGKTAEQNKIVFDEDF